MAFVDRAKLIENLDRFAPEHITPLIRSLIEKQPAADVVEVKQIEIIRDDLKWWLETNSQKGVVYIPKYVVENMIAKTDGRSGA